MMSEKNAAKQHQQKRRSPVANCNRRNRIGVRVRVSLIGKSKEEWLGFLLMHAEK